MDWCQASVFLFAGIILHFLADLLGHRKKKGKFILLHCFIYASFFLLLFWRMEVNFLWWFFLFFSHLIIDANWERLPRIIEFLIGDSIDLIPEKTKRLFVDVVTFGTDQILHLLMLIIIVFFLVV